jgi:hypothetical protein
MKKIILILLLTIPFIGFGQTTFSCDCEGGNRIIIFSVDKVNKKIYHLKTINKTVKYGIYDKKFEFENLVWKDYGVFHFEVDKDFDRIEFRIWDFINNTFTEEYHDGTPTKRTWECY